MTVQHHDVPSPDSDERYVREVLDSAMTGTRPPLGLPGAALSRGRRLRTRRRVAVTGAVAAAGVLAAVAAPWLAGSTGTDARGRADDLVATQPPAPLPRQPAGWWDMPSTDMVDAVRAIAPDGVIVTDPGPLEADTPEGGPGKGWIDPVLTSPQGSGRLNVMLYPEVRRVTLDADEGTVLAPTSGSDPGCAAPELSDASACVDVPEGQEVQVDGTEEDRLSCDVEREGRTQCAQIRDGAGTVVGRRLTSTWGDVVTHEVVLVRDGGTVYAASANSDDEKWGVGSPIAAARPPLTLDQLEDLVRNDVWVSYRP